MYFSLGGFVSFSTTAFFLGGIRRGGAFFTKGAGAGGGGATGSGCSNGIKSLAADCGADAISGSGPAVAGSIFGGAGRGSSTCSKIAGGGARNGSGCAGICCSTI